jgi:tetratricopeptide (TPR) repeat protein
LEADLITDWQIMRVAAEAAARDGSYCEAERLWLGALEFAEELAPSDPDLLYYTLESLAEVLWRNRRFDLAAPLCIRLFVAYVKRKSIDHLDVGLIAHNLALIYHQWDKPADAERFYKLAIQVLGLKLGTRNDRFIALLEAYTKLLSHNNRTRDCRLIQSYISQRVQGRWTKSGTWEAYDKKLSRYQSISTPNFARVVPTVTVAGTVR